MKRIIGISTFSYDPAGNRTLYLTPAGILTMKSGGRRATRTPTLDGGAVVYDAGYAVADLTWQINVLATSAYIGTWLASIGKTYNAIRISTDQGVFMAVPNRWWEEYGVATLEVLVTDQIA